MTTSHFTPNGNVEVDTDILRRIDIEDVRNIVSFTRATEGDETIIKLHFDSGGEFQLRCRIDGTITYFKAHHMNMAL